MSSNIQRLGNTLSGRIEKTARAVVPVTVELGIINEDMSLTVDSLAGRISPRDYMVDLHLTHDTYNTYEATHTHDGGGHMHSGCGYGGGHGGGEHSHDGGAHDHRIPSVFRRLKAGDRVLVIWVGHEPIVVSIVVSGTTVTKN